MQAAATHSRVAQLVAEAASGSVRPAAGLAALAPDELPLPHLGARVSVIQLPAAADAAVAAQRSAEVLSRQHLLHAVPPAAHGAAVTLAVPLCPPSELPVAQAAAATRPRHGWSANQTQQLRQQATLAHLPQAHCLVVLQPGQELRSSAARLAAWWQPPSCQQLLGMR